MNDDMLARIEANPKYQLLKRSRRSFGWTLTFLVLAAYYGFIGLIAFDKALLATPMGSGVMSWGIPIGIGLIVFAVAMTAVYVLRANRQFDRLSREVVKEATGL